jgi:hypothetical protein
MVPLCGCGLQFARCQTGRRRDLKELTAVYGSGLEAANRSRAQQLCAAHRSPSGLSDGLQ